MSRQKRTMKSWLQSSFDLDGFDDAPKKPKLSQNGSSKNLEATIEDFDVKVCIKKKSTNNLTSLLNVCAPQKPVDLAVSRQKQQEINRWFQEKIKHGQPNILVISGPSGCGKTEALKVLAKQNNYDVIEWTTPMDQGMDENNRTVSQVEKFEDFIVRATRYNSVLSDCSRRLLLVKDLPHSYTSGKDDFTVLLHKYCQYGREPLVFIATESGSSKLMTTLFSQSNRDRFSMEFININAVTPTALKNVMKRVSSILNNKASQMLQVTQNKIDEVLSNSIGDVRSALLNLIFSSLKVSKKFTSECSSREETLGLLHGIGRVINPKKTTTSDGKSWRFVHNPDDLASCFQTQANTFISFVHENYLNTIGPNMNGATAAIDAISMADIFNAEWRDLNMHKVALSHCVRGVMLANNKPVSQWNPVKKPNRTDFQGQKDYAAAEIEWYKNYITPKMKYPEISAEDLELLSESIIEEIGDDW
ncbi:cell cycle checkpoint protein RAD17 [Trichogramma pretiosum]|uniref:cell cycle checkpoint protein RAD17 n=1 Tax=Trichogramma pretiosum TaxID=7493 RepID=UPI0006C9DA1C|nr:cell cycle checkpoint protein RAD17 [Trichogramma pretiosum]